MEIILPLFYKRYEYEIVSSIQILIEETIPNKLRKLLLGNVLT